MGEVRVGGHTGGGMKTVYIETSIPSFYVETRQEPEMVARRNWTREWWATLSTWHWPLTTSVIFF